MNISEQTKIFLRESKWSQSRLAAEIGVNVVSLNRYLLRQKKKGTGERLAEFLMERGLTGAPVVPPVGAADGDDAAGSGNAGMPPTAGESGSRA